MLRRAGYLLVALTPAADAIDIADAANAPELAGRRIALLVGSEGAGLDDQTLARADFRVAIKMAPGVDSLNVATATGIALHRFAHLYVAFHFRSVRKPAVTNFRRLTSAPHVSGCGGGRCLAACDSLHGVRLAADRSVSPRHPDRERDGSRRRVCAHVAAPATAAETERPAAAIGTRARTGVDSRTGQALARIRVEITGSERITVSEKSDKTDAAPRASATTRNDC